MTAKQENKLNMYLAVTVVCSRYQTTWQTLPAFVDAYTEFETQVTNIQTLAQKQSVESTGLAADKKQLRETMAQATVAVALAVNAYAKKIKNNDLAAKTAVAVTDFTQGRDTLAAPNAMKIHAAATEVLSHLSPYGITAEKLVELKAKIDAYAASISKPRDAVGTNSTVTKQIGDAFKAADAAVNDQMDALMPQLGLGDPTFAADYKSARIIVDTGARKAKPPTPPRRRHNLTEEIKNPGVKGPGKNKPVRRKAGGFCVGGCF